MTVLQKDVYSDAAQLNMDIIEQHLNILPRGHVLYELYSEHSIILKLLMKLDSVREKINLLSSRLDEPELLLELSNYAETLMLTENHHIREEKLLFFELEKYGIHLHHHVLISEHTFLRSYKQNFYDLVTTLEKVDFRTYKTRMNYMANGIIGILREHTYRENNEVFPMALKVIKDPQVWDKMKIEADKIGYCFNRTSQ